MTRELFYEDAFCREFQARVLSCRPSTPLVGTKKTAKQTKEEIPGEGYEVILDQTAFYPEGGGQNPDRGVLRYLGEEGVCQEGHITDTQRRGGEIVHVCDTFLPPGTPVTGILDWEYRFDQMQNHTGEHIVSGLIHAKFGYENVGFHMGSDFITIDLDGLLDEAGMREIEAAANQVIWEDRPVQIAAYTQEEIKNKTYRSKKELTGEVRLVTIPEADSCACCGIHVARTGQIGLVRLLSCEKFRGGVRIELLCGRRALSYLGKIWEQNRIISHLLSARPLQTGEAVARLQQKEAKEAEQLYAYGLKQAAQLAREMEGRGNVLLFVQEELPPDQVRRMADAVMGSCGGISGVFAGNDQSGYQYALGRLGGDICALVKELNATASGRGGGKPQFAQGRLLGSRSQICDFLCKSNGPWYIKEV